MLLFFKQLLLNKSRTHPVETCRELSLAEYPKMHFTSEYPKMHFTSSKSNSAGEKVVKENVINDADV